MRFAWIRREGLAQLAAVDGERMFVAAAAGGAGPDLRALLAAGGDALADAYRELLGGVEVDAGAVEYLPPVPYPSKIVCVGLNYTDHATESGFEAPKYPVLFGRFPSSLIGHGAAIVRPRVSDELDYEGELVAIIGKPGRNIAKERALEHVAGYSIFNDASVRDYQFKSGQWTMGKNFDGTGAFGPGFVSADELEPGAKGLRLRTRLNGEVLQDALTTDMIFDVATLVSVVSEAMELQPGDVLVTGTPSGVGLAREPKLWMKPGDAVEVEVEGVGVLRNPVVQQG